MRKVSSKFSQTWIGICTKLLFVSIALPFGLISHVFAQERVYFGNLHSHTSYSDGTGTPREAYQHARDVAKLDFLALTEHNHLKAMGKDKIGIAANNALYNGGANSLIKTALSMTKNGKFVALYGQEFSVISRGNHSNVFEISKVITAASGEFDQLANFLNDNLDSAGKPAIIMFNHPKNATTIQDIEYGFDDFASQEEWVSKLGQHLALMQMINGPGQRSGINLPIASPAEAAYRKFLSLGFRMAPTADQDNHTRNWGNATNARTAVIATSLTRSSILEAIRQRHVYASEDKNLSVVIKVNGHLCGDIISPIPSPVEANIMFSINDPDEPQAQYEIEVWRGSIGGKPAKVVSTITTSAGNGTIEDVALTGVPEYFFFKIRQSDTDNNEDEQEDRVWTAPIWFETAPQPDLVSDITIETPLDDPAINSFVASKKSKIFHVSNECLDAQRIKPSNLITGANARTGRVLHDDCPRKSHN